MNPLVGVIGAGPAGIEMAAALKAAEMPYVLFEAGQVGATIERWPDATRAFSRPEMMALASVPASPVSGERFTREEYLAYLRVVVQQRELKINTHENVTDVQRTSAGHFLITTEKEAVRIVEVKYLIMATGCLHKHRKLGIPGEERRHVHFAPRQFHTYFLQHVLVVGGRNSALEYAVRCVRAGAKSVSLSYRRHAFAEHEVKRHLLQDVERLISDGRMRFYPGSIPTEILPRSVVLKVGETDIRETVEDVDFVIIACGYQADNTLMKRVGANLAGSTEQPDYDRETFETSVPNLFVVGTATAGTQASGYSVFIEHSRSHAKKIVQYILRHCEGR